MPLYEIRGGDTGHEEGYTARMFPGQRLVPTMGNVQLNSSWTLKGLAFGTYYWSVQAVDTGFMGGPWASEQEAAVP